MSVRDEDIRTDTTKGVATITLCAPSRRNALDGEMARAATRAIAEAAQDEAVGAIVLTGEAPAFCAGADRSLLARAGRPGHEAARRDLDSIYEFFLALGRCEVPTVAAVNGAAIGAGLNLALAADLCVVARKARLLSGFLRIGIHPGGGHHLLVRRSAGLSAANALAMFDQEIDGAHAVTLGLAWEATDAGQVVSRAVEIAAIAGERPELSRLITRTARRAGTGTEWPGQVEAERGAQLASLLAGSRAEADGGDG